jgi:hypothetical protein
MTVSIIYSYTLWILSGSSCAQGVCTEYNFFNNFINDFKLEGNYSSPLQPLENPSPEPEFSLAKAHSGVSTACVNSTCQTRLKKLRELKQASTINIFNDQI